MAQLERTPADVTWLHTLAAMTHHVTHPVCVRPVQRRLQMLSFKFPGLRLFKSKNMGRRDADRDSGDLSCSDLGVDRLHFSHLHAILLTGKQRDRKTTNTEDYSTRVVTDLLYIIVA